MGNAWYDHEDASDLIDIGYGDARRALAATLTRLRATVKDLDSEDDRAYVRALEHVASAHDIKSRTETIIKFSA